MDELFILFTDFEKFFNKEKIKFELGEDDSLFLKNHSNKVWISQKYYTNNLDLIKKSYGFVIFIKRLQSHKFVTTIINYVKSKDFNLIKSIKNMKIIEVALKLSFDKEINPDNDFFTKLTFRSNKLFKKLTNSSKSLTLFDSHYAYNFCPHYISVKLFDITVKDDKINILLKNFDSFKKTINNLNNKNYL